MYPLGRHFPAGCRKSWRVVIARCAHWLRSAHSSSSVHRKPSFTDSQRVSTADVFILTVTVIAKQLPRLRSTAEGHLWSIFILFISRFLSCRQKHERRADVNLHALWLTYVYARCWYIVSSPGVDTRHLFVTLATRSLAAPPRPAAALSINLSIP